MVVIRTEIKELPDSMTKEDEGLCDKDFEAWERNPTATCFACIEDWLSEELDFEMEGLKNEWGNN